MSNILQFVENLQPGAYVESGVIVAALQGGDFVVSINGKTMSMGATVDTVALTPGMRVVINRTPTDRYIIGSTRQFASQKTQEVIIDG